MLSLFAVFQQVQVTSTQVQVQVGADLGLKVHFSPTKAAICAAVRPTELTRSVSAPASRIMVVISVFPVETRTTYRGIRQMGNPAHRPQFLSLGLVLMDNYVVRNQLHIMVSLTDLKGLRASVRCSHNHARCS